MLCILLTRPQSQQSILSLKNQKFEAQNMQICDLNQALKLNEESLIKFKSFYLLT